MRRRTRLRSLPLLTAALTALAAATAGIAYATPARTPLTACYRIAWDGFPVARMIYTQQPGQSYRAAVLIETQGLAGVFGPFRYEAEASGTTPPAGRPVPASYTALDGHDAEDRRRIALAFDAATGAVREAIDPPRPTKVPPAARTGAIDPLTAFLRIRQALLNDRLAAADGAQVLSIYDGSKRYDLALTVVGLRDLPAGPLPGPVVHARLRVLPVDPFPRPERLPEEPIDVYYSPAAGYLPVLASGGGRTVRLTDMRDDGGACRD